VRDNPQYPRRRSVGKRTGGEQRWGGGRGGGKKGETTREGKFGSVARAAWLQVREATFQSIKGLHERIEYQQGVLSLTQSMPIPQMARESYLTPSRS